MSLAPETKLAHYEITSQIGKGGMGEVYKAKDQKLGRDVAIKVLPEEFAKDADRVARFQREAKLLASLNHPNIAAIYGLEESNGTHFLVLELIDGDTLADRIKGGPIPVEESLKLALQIAEALEAAHEKGVIHRDLKPANIKVTPDGKVKVLDFGLAKAFAGDQAEVNLSNSPTLSEAATMQGVILGTAAYMSPEQARGKPVDKRTDIWAFGVVLYEMLTGKSLFAAEDVTSTLARVLERDPNFSVLPPNLHPRIRLLLERCLKKEPKDRYGSISDGRVDIQDVLADPNGFLVQPTAEVEAKSRLRTTLSWSAAIFIVGVAVWMLKPAPPPEPKQVVSFEYELPEDQNFGLTSLENRAFAISPDGTKFVYATPQGLYLRSMDELSVLSLAGSEENARNPFFSPDGQWIGYISGTPPLGGTGGKLKKISVNGGAPTSIVDVSGVYGYLSWCEDDTIVYAPNGGANIMRISANGGDPELLVEGQGSGLIAPQILPDGKTVMFTMGPEPLKIMLHSLETGDQKELIEGNTAQYLPSGHIVYVNDNNLFAIRFDLDRLEKTGGPIRMIEGILRILSAPQYAVSDSGVLVYMPESTMRATSNFAQSLKSTLGWVDLKGKEEPIAADPHLYGQGKISPDGTKAAVSVIAEEGSSDIWILDLSRKNLTPLTRDGNSSNPLWTPDGQRIVFVSGDEDQSGIYWMAANGIGKADLLGTVPGGILIPNSWSKDRKTLIATKHPPPHERARSRAGRMLQMLARGGIFMSSPAGQGGRRNGGSSGGKAGVMSQTSGPSIDIGLLSMEGNHEWKPLLQEEYDESDPQISPDGRWIAYTSSESEQQEVCLRPFPDVNKGKWNVSVGGGSLPFWSPDGRELYYFNAGEFMAVLFEADPAVKLGTPKSLFRFSGPYIAPDLSSDGKRFLVTKLSRTTNGQSADGESRPKLLRKINIVLNWFEELKQRVPVK